HAAGTRPRKRSPKPLRPLPPRSPPIEPARETPHPAIPAALRSIPKTTPAETRTAASRCEPSTPESAPRYWETERTATAARTPSRTARTPTLCETSVRSAHSASRLPVRPATEKQTRSPPAPKAPEPPPSPPTPRGPPESTETGHDKESRDN